jgi:phosphinothricin acetyltransferase
MVDIRDVRIEDAGQIAGIYAHHVLNGTASYELEPPTAEETAAKIDRIISRGWPFLVAVEEGDVLGYAYAEQLRDRPAYRFTCENSIYIQANLRGRGIGKALLTALCARCEALGFRQMIAVIGGAEPASIALHQSCGFGMAGRLRSVGWKKEHWLDTVYMQRPLGDGAETVPSVI